MLLLKRRQNNFIKGGAAADSSVWRMLLPSFLGIIVCTICLAGMTWAWFTSGVQSQSTISAEEYSLGETVRVQNRDVLTKSNDGKYALAANTTYVLTLNPNTEPSGGGYCIIQITSGGTTSTYYTEALTRGQEYNFTISNGNSNVTCKVLAAWGAPGAAGFDGATQVLDNKIVINGGASSDASTQEPTENMQSAPATKDNKDGSSGGSSLDSTSGQDGANSQNQTTKDSDSDKANDKTN